MYPCPLLFYGPAGTLPKLKNSVQMETPSFNLALELYCDSLCIAPSEKEFPAFELDKVRVEEFLQSVREEVPYIFVWLENLPVSDFSIDRVYSYRDYRADTKALNAGLVREHYAVRDFAAKSSSFHKNDGFRIRFRPSLLKLDYRASRSTLEDLYKRFLELRCEAAMRANRPLRLTEKDVQRYGLDPQSAGRVQAYLKCYNDKARRVLQAEYDALKGLSCIRK